MASSSSNALTSKSGQKVRVHWESKGTCHGLNICPPKKGRLPPLFSAPLWELLGWWSEVLWARACPWRILGSSSPFPYFVHGREGNLNAFAHLSSAHDVLSLTKSGGAVVSQNELFLFLSRLPQQCITVPGGLLNIRASKRGIGPKIAVFAYDIISYEDI